VENLRQKMFDFHRVIHISGAKIAADFD